MNITLDQVAKAFENWRATRSKRGPIPKELISQTVDLSSQYSKSEITRRLGINHGMLNRWIGRQPEDNTFIALPASDIKPMTPIANNALEISIKFGNGAQLTLAGAESKAAAFISELQQRGAL